MPTQPTSRTSSSKRTKAEIDPTLLPRILAVLGVGAGRKAACEQVGIAVETLRDYERIGKAACEKREAAVLAEEEVTLDAREMLFARFYDDLRSAESNTKVYLLGLLQRAAKADWKSGAWLLERLYPSEFGKRSEVDLRAELSGRVSHDVDLSKLDEDELWVLRGLTDKAVRGETE